jgi:tetratricopeptide (TPR) repeat protein
MIKFTKIKRIITIFLVLCLLLVAACAPPQANDELVASIRAHVQESWRKGVAEGTVDYTAPVYDSLRTGKYDEAVAQCEELREIRPNDPIIFTIEGYAYMQKNDHLTAISRFSSAISIDANRGEPYFFRAKIHFVMGHDKESLNDLDKGMSNRNFFTQLVSFYRKIDAGTNKELTEGTMGGIVFQIQALAYGRLGKMDLAIASADKAIRETPTSADLYFTRGMLYSDQQKYGAAYESFEKAIELNPEDSSSWNFAGAINLKLGSYTKAVVQFQKAAKLDPLRTDILTNYGLAYWLQGDKVKAFEYMGKAMRAEPGFTTYYHVAYFHHLSGREDKALEYFKKAYTLNKGIIQTRTTIMSSTPATSPTRKFYQDELRTAETYIKTGKTPTAVAYENRSSRFEITDITFTPDPVPLSTSFDFHVRFEVDVSSSSDDTIPTDLSFKILRGSKILFTSGSYSVNTNNGGIKDWTLHMNPVKTKGTYTVQVTIKYKNMLSKKSVALYIH